MQGQNLVAQAEKSGETLMRILREGEKRSGGKICNLRGMGTLLAFDCSKGGEWRNELQRRLRDNGALMGVNGDASIRFRPTLVCTSEHMEQFGKIFFKTLDEMP